MAQATVGLLHPGEMGATVGAAARSGGARVIWSSHRRSPETARRAAGAGLEDVGKLSALVEASDVIVSVCPPHAAGEVAGAVAAHGFRGLYLDANAISPATARGLAARLAPAELVDGGIVGPPARMSGTTRLYLSGNAAERTAALFAGSPLEAIPLDGGPGAASALKLAFASYTKGTSALLMAIRAFAIREGVDAALLAEWSRSLPDLPARSAGAVRGTARKAWRFVGEMEEIAESFAAAGLPGGFHRAAAELYRRLARYRGSEEPPSVEEVARLLRGG